MGWRCVAIFAGRRKLEAALLGNLALWSWFGRHDFAISSPVVGFVTSVSTVVACGIGRER